MKGSDFIFNKNKPQFYVLELDKYSYDFSQSFMCKDKELIDDFFNILKENSNNIIFLKSKFFGYIQILSHDYHNNNSIITLQGASIETNYLTLKTNYLHFKDLNENHQLKKDKYYIHNLQTYKNNIIFILDLNSNEILFIRKDEYKNLVGHALDYFKACLQELNDKILSIEERIDKNE